MAADRKQEKSNPPEINGRKDDGRYIPKPFSQRKRCKKRLVCFMQSFWHRSVSRWIRALNFIKLETESKRAGKRG
ncbi:hypothetical protein NPIL_147681 [Nephila pilipes]|uniref:Uncharacterized protein n=1 Tax=Nephila pilipes TaxID=299642 RepID=A0A8X6TY59_NEPPI|nr:hypothetical protein NPIL_147681 [Nephila pilipes]